MKVSPALPIANRGMRLLRIVTLALGAAALGFAFWIVLRAPNPPANWLTVEAPRTAYVNQPVKIRLTLPPPSLPGMLMADLHWFTGHHEPRGFLSSAPRHPVTAEGGVFTFEIPVPVRPDLGAVRVVIYLGPTTRWVDHRKAAVTDDIPVRIESSAHVETTLQPLRAHEDVPSPAVRPREATWGRLLMATLWTMAGGFAWWGDRRRKYESSAGTPKNSRGRHWLAFGCLAVAGFEFGGVDRQLAVALHNYAVEHRIYYERRWVQQTATLLVLVGAAIAARSTLRQTHFPARFLSVVSLGLFVVVSLLELFSLHELDPILALPIGPLPLVQLVQLSAAIIATVALGLQAVSR